ncbi:DUF1190 domain-containing protein [Aliivibrio wodanis]|uniref:DUF1190 domain-containing protein n=1 Tax=Aliivibrio wodanis TaxID=80852 RepID=UPI00406CFBFA
MMSVRKGQVEVNKHLKPHSMYLKPLTLMAVAAGVSGCSDDDSIYFFESVGDCKKDARFNEAECISAYQIAEKKAQEASFEYRTEKECFDEFGFGVCQLNDKKKYQPNNFGWIMSHSQINKNKDSYKMFVEPVYLSTNPRSSKFTYLMFTDKNYRNYYIGKYNLANDAKVDLPKGAMLEKEYLKKHSSGSYYNDSVGVITYNNWDDHRNYYSYGYLHNTTTPSKVVKYKKPKFEDSKLSKTKSAKNISFSSSKSVKGFGSTSRSKSSWGG